ncbi:hypothetical protein JTE90_015364 [Oedothorax gibbosus]|uniref:Origin recognition complex subunit 2 n=1 Tax=Oedothorax gibbosus TaxID=931172 RepID=A0AAV6U5A3_9ARAC|nr:hypothetical protein JTE90_015364 [Oedothorax gibbosus]
MSSKSPRSAKKRPSSRKSLRTKEDIVCAPIKATLESSENFEDYQPSAGLFEEEKDVGGNDVFQVTPLKPKKLLKDPVSTGKLINKLSSVTLASPKMKTPQVETPKEKQGYSLRQRMKRELANLQVSNMESDPEDSDEYNSNDEDSENDNHNIADPVTPKKSKDKSSRSFPETYFFAQKQKKAATSNRTLANLKLEQTDIEQLRNIMTSASEYHKKEKENLYKQYKSQFEKWQFLLHEGFNVLLYGVGSKQKILNSFCKECLGKALHVVIHGFFPSLTIKQVLNSITEDALEYEGKFSSIYDHAEYIKNYFQEGKEELYLIFHNIDGMPLRNVKTQTLLSVLASIPNIHFVCSVDHINSPLIWDQIMLSHFKWVWFDVTTFEPYILETSYENSIFKDQSSHLLLSSLLHVYRSLTPNGQGVFMILANHQKEEKSQTFSGITFHEWYQECREAFLVNSEITMQAQLSEFKNHKLLTSRKSIEGTEVWYIPVDGATLEQFLESCK